MMDTEMRWQRLAGLIAALLVASAHGAELSNQQREQALRATAANAPECKTLGDFYWEVGTSSQIAAHGAIGSEYDGPTVMRIASASKLVFGTYVLEKIGKNTELSHDQLRELEMLSGYTSLKYPSCVFSRTVQACFNHRGNDDFTAQNVDHFYYNGGHDQKLAIDLGLANMNSAEFGAELRKYLGGDVNIDFGSPQPAGGMKTSAADYGKFLRKILSGQLRMHDYLGSNPVCTLPRACPSALESPVPLAWHYSLNHWVEDDPSGDGAFSSPGAFGFYPWISADKQWYGILARESHRIGAYKESVYCGVKLRKAWMSGQATQ